MHGSRDVEADDLHDNGRIGDCFPLAEHDGLVADRERQGVTRTVDEPDRLTIRLEEPCPGEITHGRGRCGLRRRTRSGQAQQNRGHVRASSHEWLLGTHSSIGGRDARLERIVDRRSVRDAALAP